MFSETLGTLNEFCLQDVLLIFVLHEEKTFFIENITKTIVLTIYFH